MFAAWRARRRRHRRDADLLAAWDAAVLAGDTFAQFRISDADWEQTLALMWRRGMFRACGARIEVPAWMISDAVAAEGTTPTTPPFSDLAAQVRALALAPLAAAMTDKNGILTDVHAQTPRHTLAGPASLTFSAFKQSWSDETAERHLAQREAERAERERIGKQGKPPNWAATGEMSAWPKWLYHRQHRPRMVHTPREQEQLGAGWAEVPPRQKAKR